MSRLPEPGADEDIWGEILNDFLAVSHLDDGRIRVSALPAPQVADGSITPAKLSQAYLPASSLGAYNGVASLDNTGKLPAGQLPSGAMGADATTSSKGVVQLAGDLGGTATNPTVPALSQKYVKPFGGIPETDLDSNVQTKLNSGGSVGDATASVKGVLQLAGDLGGSATSPTVPGLANKINTSARGAVNGVASLDNTGRVPVAQLPAGYEADATTSAKGIVQLAGDLGGTAALPTVPALANKADKTTTVSAGTGLTGGGDLSANRTLTVSYGATAGTAAQGNDSRITGAEQTSNKGAVNGYASLDNTGKVPTAQLPSTTAVSHTEAFSSTSTLTADVGVHRLYNDTSAAWTILSVRSSVGTAPTGASIIVDVNVSGTTIFTTQANRPTIAAASNTSGKVTNMNVTSIPAGSYLTVDIDQIGSTIPGSDLTVQVEVT